MSEEVWLIVFMLCVESIALTFGLVMLMGDIAKYYRAKRREL